MRRALMLTVAIAIATLGSQVLGGLRDIRPRPQQMGMISAEPLMIPGTFYLVVPDNPTADETAVREDLLQRVTSRVTRVPIVVQWSQYGGQLPALWFGTAERMPALMSALDSTGIGGLGTFLHTEAYQLHIGEHRILLGASDLRGLRWGMMSLVSLMSEANGAMYVDRCYIRDWPDLPQRVITVNSAIRNEEQAGLVNQLVDLGYESKMNEVEWNDQDAGKDRSGFALLNALAVRDKLRSRGTALTMSADRTAATIEQHQYQEGVPAAGTKLRVASNGAMYVIPNTFNYTVTNGGFEQWTGGLPTGWTQYRPEYAGWVQRDQSIRHSGGSSVKFYNLPTAPLDLDIRRYDMVVAPNQYLRIKFWYKLSSFRGGLRVRFHGPGPVDGKMDERFIRFPSTTTQDWTLGSFNFATGYTDSISIYVGLYGSCTGTAWIDDVSIEAGTVEHLVRRPDTPLSIYKLPGNLQMVEGLDFQITDTSGYAHTNYSVAPRIIAVPGGRLAVNDSVRMNWHCAVQYQGDRQTPCFSLTEPLVLYQERIRKLDSLMHPDGFKIHINEVSYAGYDSLCTSRNLTPGRLVGKYCDDMYDIIQSYRPGAPVRIYGDAVDVHVHDPRLHPIATRPWTLGALQELAPAVQIMAMSDYSQNLDSSLSYFQANGHTSLVAGDFANGLPKFVNGALAARRWPQSVRGMQFYDWGLDRYLQLVPGVADLAWNMGPYIMHTPVVFSSQPSSVTIRAEMWTDPFGASQLPQLTTKQLRYRLLPSGSWTTVNMAAEGTDGYASTVSLTGPGVIGLEYYITTTDSRGQTRTSPYHAPAETFEARFPGQGGPNVAAPNYGEVGYSVTTIGERLSLEWSPIDGAVWYEVHYGESPDFNEGSETLLSRQQICCPRYLLSRDDMPHYDIARMHVFAVFDGETSTPARQ